MSERCCLLGHKKNMYRKRKTKAQRVDSVSLDRTNERSADQDSHCRVTYRHKNMEGAKTQQRQQQMSWVENDRCQQYGKEGNEKTQAENWRSPEKSAVTGLKQEQVKKEVCGKENYSIAVETKGKA